MYFITEETLHSFNHFRTSTLCASLLDKNQIIKFFAFSALHIHKPRFCLCQYRFVRFQRKKQIIQVICPLKSKDFCVFQPLKLKLNKHSSIKAHCSKVNYKSILRVLPSEKYQVTPFGYFNVAVLKEVFVFRSACIKILPCFYLDTAVVKLTYV